MRAVCSLVLVAACAGDTLAVQRDDLEGMRGGVNSVELDALEEDAGSDSVETEREPEDVYAPTRLAVYRFSIDSAAEEQLASQPREYVPAQLEFVDGEDAERMEVGLRLKGEASFRKLDGKAAFRIKIDAFHRGQRFRGRRALTLNNMLQDRSLMAERLAYHTFRELGAPAPRANHALVYVNDVYYGVYANIETPNKDFLAVWFDDPERNLYEEAGRDFAAPRAAESFELETNERDPDERANLLALAQACADGDLERARQLVDWPRFLLYSALEAAVNQVDGYSYAQAGPNNYRIYDAAGGFVFIPWGLDWAFGTVDTQDGGLFVDPFWVRPKHGVLMRMCLSDDACTREYRDVVEEVASRWEGLELERHMDEWSEQIRAAFEMDHRREVSHELALADRAVTREFIRGRAQALREALERH